MPGERKHEPVDMREVLATSAEVERMIVRRLAEGAPAAVIAAGIALALTMTDRAVPGANLSGNVVDCLRSGAESDHAS